MKMLTEDLRSWIREAEKKKSIRNFKGANWDEEIGCITHLNTGKEPPALLFDDIKGYPPGYRVICSVIRGQPNIELTLNLPAHKTKLALLNTLQTKLPEWAIKAPEFPPKFVDSGPIFEEVHS